MTWKQFKKFVETSGVKNNFELLYIDVSHPKDNSDIPVIVVADSKLKNFYIEN